MAELVDSIFLKKISRKRNQTGRMKLNFLNNDLCTSLFDCAFSIRRIYFDRFESHFYYSFLFQKLIQLKAEISLFSLLSLFVQFSLMVINKKIVWREAVIFKGELSLGREVKIKFPIPPAITFEPDECCG